MLCLQRLGGDLNCRFLPWSDGWIAVVDGVDRMPEKAWKVKSKAKERTRVERPVAHCTAVFHQVVFPLKSMSFLNVTSLTFLMQQDYPSFFCGVHTHTHLHMRTYAYICLSTFTRMSEKGGLEAAHLSVFPSPTPHPFLISLISLISTLAWLCCCNLASDGFSLSIFSLSLWVLCQYIHTHIIQYIVWRCSLSYIKQVEHINFVHLLNLLLLNFDRLEKETVARPGEECQRFVSTRPRNGILWHPVAFMTSKKLLQAAKGEKGKRWTQSSRDWLESVGTQQQPRHHQCYSVLNKLDRVIEDFLSGVKAAERAADVTQLHRMRTDFVRGILELDMLSFLF